MGIVNLSDQTGHYEAIIFSEGLTTYRDLLEPGKPVLLVLQAGVEGDEVRARIQSVEPLDDALARHRNDMRIFLRDPRPIASVQERLRARGAEARGEGEVSLILILDQGEREVEVKLKGRYPASPAIAGALRAVPGVVDVQMT
jgi:DNA polymerase-3 subunit alpha